MTDFAISPNIIEYQAERACVRKIAYRSRKSVKDAASHATRDFRCAMTYYRCKFCGNWHTAKKR